METIVIRISPEIQLYILSFLTIFFCIQLIKSMHIASKKLAEFRYYGDFLWVPDKNDRIFFLYLLIVISYVSSFLMFVGLNIYGLSNYAYIPISFLFLVYIFNAAFAKNPIRPPEIRG